MSFRPRTGDYFFIALIGLTKEQNEELRLRFPSPYWGLIFYHKQIAEMSNEIFVEVSVPILGIIYLS